MNQTLTHNGRTGIEGLSDNRAIKQSKKNREVVRLQNRMMKMMRSGASCSLMHNREKNKPKVLSLLGEDALYDIFFHKVKTREDVLDLEDQIKKMPTAYNKCPYRMFHSFANGMYTRDIHIDKGDLAVGAIHRSDYFVNVLKGHLWVVSEFGSREIIAPYSFIAKAGVKHIVFTLEDTVWTDTHKTSMTTIKEAEKEIFVDSYEELDRLNRVMEYSAMCKEIDLSEDDAYQVARTESDLMEQADQAPIEIRESNIEGLGVFVTRDINKGNRIALARQDNKRTPAGRYTNHSDRPNAGALIDNKKGFFFALKTIKKGSEVTVDYRDVRNKAVLLDEYLSCLDG